MLKLLDLCNDHTVRQLNTVLAAGARHVFSLLHAEFTQYYKYSRRHDDQHVAPPGESHYIQRLYTAWTSSSEWRILCETRKMQINWFVDWFTDLSDWVEVFRPSRHKVGHLTDTVLIQSWLAVYSWICGDWSIVASDVPVTEAWTHTHYTWQFDCCWNIQVLNSS